MDCYIGEIKMFAGNFAPSGWLLCNGSTLPIQGNETLYSLLGTTYGGDGITNFALPDLREQVVVGKGQLGTTNYTTGSKGGANTVVLTIANIPPHNHPINAYADTATTASPTGTSVLANSVPQGAGYTDAKLYVSLPAGTTNPDSPLDPVAVASYGGSVAHDNLMPYLTINYIIARAGLYPQQQ
jgi:Microcystin-dependent protein